MRKQPVKRVFSSVNFHQPDYGLKSGKLSNGAGGSIANIKIKLQKQVNISQPLKISHLAAFFNQIDIRYNFILASFLSILQQLDLKIRQIDTLIFKQTTNRFLENLFTHVQAIVNFLRGAFITK